MEPSGSQARAAVQLSARWVLAALDRFRRRAAWGELRARLLVLAAGATVALLLLVALDHAWPGGLPRPARLLALGVLGCAAAAGVVAGEWQRRRRALSRVFVAQRLERTAAIRHNSLINALAVRETAAAAYAEAAAFRQAARELARVPPVEALVVGVGRGPLLLCGVALAAWILYAVLAAKPIAPALLRVLGWEQAPATATQLLLVRPAADEAIHAGEPAVLEFAVRGRPVRQAELTLRTAAGLEAGRSYAAAVELDPEADVRRARFVLAPHEVGDAIRFRCTAGDGLLEGVIPVQPLPAVAQLDVWLEPPAYSGLPPGPAESPDLTVWSGTVARLMLTANATLRDPMVVFVTDRETRTRMQVEPAAPRSATAALLLTESGTYRFEFADPWGYPYRDPPSYRVTVRTDGAPRVQIVAPDEAAAPDGVVAAAGVPEIIALAEDDLGVAEFAMCVERGTALERRPLPADAPRVQARVPTREIAPPGGPDARVWFEARDARVTLDGRPAPQAARSRTLTVLAERAPRVDQPRPEREGGRANPGPEATPGPQPGQDDAGGGADGDRPTTRPVEPAAGDSAEPQAGTGDGESSADPRGDDPGEPAAGSDGAGDEFANPGDDGTGESAGAERSGEPSSGEPAPTAEAAEPSDTGEAQAGDETARDDPVGGFVREHGREAGEVVRRLREKNGEGQPVGPASPGEPAPDSGTHSVGDGANAQPPEESGAKESANDPRGAEGAEGNAPPAGDTPPGESAGSTPGAPPESQPARGGALDRPAAEPRTALESDGAQDVLDLLEMLERGATVSEEELIELGWPAEKAAAFLKALERTRAVLADLPPGAVRRIVFEARLGAAGVQRGVGLAPDARTEAAADGGSRERLGRIAPPPEQQVPENLRALLAAYYRAVAERRAAASGTEREP